MSGISDWRTCFATKFDARDDTWRVEIRTGSWNRIEYDPTARISPAGCRSAHGAYSGHRAQYGIQLGWHYMRWTLGTQSQSDFLGRSTKGEWWCNALLCKGFKRRDGTVLVRPIVRRCRLYLPAPVRQRPERQLWYNGLHRKSRCIRS